MNAFKKVMLKIKEFFKDPKEVISFFAPIIIAIILVIPVPYYVTVGGGTLDFSSKIEISEEYESKGSLKAAYVREMNGNVLMYILGKIVPDFELTKVSSVILDNDSEKDYNIREKIMFNDSFSNATKVVYDYLNKDIKVKERNLYITYIDPKAKSNLKTFDLIKEVEGEKVYDSDDVLELINKNLYRDEVHIKVLRNKKEVMTISKPVMFEDGKKLGIYVATNYKYETNPKVKFKFSSREAGPSGGLMLSLNLYNKLTEDDITKGKKIVGTGAIDIDGNVLEIGGVKYKLMGAIKDKADLFIVPKENYEEAISWAKKKKYDIDIYGVKTFDEAIKLLNNLD